MMPRGSRESTAERGMKRRWVLPRVSGGVMKMPWESARESRRVRLAWTEAFEGVAVGEAEAKPEAFGAGTGSEAAAVEAFRDVLVGEVEVADVGDPLDVGEKEWGDAGSRVDKLDVAMQKGNLLREIAPMELIVEATDDDLLLTRSHEERSQRLSHSIAAQSALKIHQNAQIVVQSGVAADERSRLNS